MAIGDVIRKWAEVVTGARDLHANVRSVRADLEKAKRERDAMAAAPLTREDMKQIVLQDIDRRAKSFSVAFQASLVPMAHKPVSVAEVVARQGVPIMMAVAAPNRVAGPDTMENALYGLFGEQLKKAVGDAIDQMEWPAAGLPLDEREEVLEELDEQIEELEHKNRELTEIAAKLRG